MGAQGESPAAASAERWKTASAVMIGVVSLMAAFLTYTSVRLDDTAVDLDRRAVMETAAVEQERATAAIQVAAEVAAVAQHRVLLAHADVLDSVHGSGGSADARTSRALARQLAASSFDATFLEGAGAASTYDAGARLAALLTENQETAQLDPELTAAQADAARSRSVRLVGWVIGMLAVIGALSLAQLLRPSLRPAVVTGSVVAFVVLTATSVLVDVT